MKIGRLPLIPYYRPGDPQLGEAIRGCAAGTARCCSPTTDRSCPGRRSTPPSTPIEELEETAKLFLLLRGTPTRPLDAGQIDELDAVFGPAGQ